MGFRNPIVLADEVTSGNFAGQYTIGGLMIVGNPAASHVAIGTDAHGADGVRLYASDGVTPLIDLNIGTPSIAGSVIAGPVASATNATNATNLAGGGTAAGSTAITGALVVGNASASHVVVGSDVHGADGVRLYASDGVTPLIDLNITGTPTITGALIRTAASGQRVEISGSARDTISLFTGIAAEASAPQIWSQQGATTVGAESVQLIAQSGTTNVSVLREAVRLTMTSGTADGSAGGKFAVSFGTLGTGHSGIFQDRFQVGLVGSTGAFGTNTVGTAQVVGTLAIVPPTSGTGDRLTISDNTPTVFMNVTSANDFNVSNSQYSAQFFGATNATSFATGVFLAAAAAAVRPLVIRGTTSQVGALLQVQNVGTATIAQVTNSGNVQGTGAYTTLSDRSEKATVIDLPTTDALGVIRRLRPRHYRYRSTPTEEHAGWDAQELAAVIPVAVVPFDDHRQGVRETAIIPYLVAAVQQLDDATRTARPSLIALDTAA